MPFGLQDQVLLHESGLCFQYHFRYTHRPRSAVLSFLFHFPEHRRLYCRLRRTTKSRGDIHFVVVVVDDSAVRQDDLICVPKSLSYVETEVLADDLKTTEPLLH